MSNHVADDNLVWTDIADWQQWAGLIIDAEKPAALSSRDGRLLRRPSVPAKLERDQLVKALQQALTEGLQQHARDLLVEAQGMAFVCPFDMQPAHQW